MDDPVEVLRDFAAGVCHDPSCQDCQEDHRPTIANAIDAVLFERDALCEENARLRDALCPFIQRHCGLCVPLDNQGRMSKVTEESCVCDADQKRARAALRGGGK